MMMKSIVLAILAALFSLSSSMLVVQAAAPDSDVEAAVTVSSKLRKAAAAGVPAEERKLQSQTCYKDGGNGQASPASCDSVGSCNGWSCCIDAQSCYGLGQFWCEISNGFAIEQVNEFACPYKWTCCY